jgi:hypothetical protein
MWTMARGIFKDKIRKKIWNHLMHIHILGICGTFLGGLTSLAHKMLACAAERQM